jgi:DNA replication and repair protein RecF
MRLIQFQLTSFRNIPGLNISPSSGLNFFVGKNGQGKTSCIEAIAYLSSLRSFRGSTSEEMIQWNSDQSVIHGLVSPEVGDLQVDLRVTFQKENFRIKKLASINGKKLSSSGQYLLQRFGQIELGFHTIVFNPSDHQLIQGDPSGRRKYINQVLSAEQGDTIELISNYQRALEQRNRLLKDGLRPTNSQVLGFTDQLIPLGSEIILRRLQWFKSVHPHLKRHAALIAPRQPEISVEYESSVLDSNNGFQRVFTGQEEVPSLQILERNFREKFEFHSDKEGRTGTTIVGPHRDDWRILLGSRVLKGHGSQGEVRTSLLALKLSEIDSFQEKTGHQPVLLMDDFSSELDRERRNFLLSLVQSSPLQVFVTTTEWLPEYGGKVFNVEDGEVSEFHKLSPVAEEYKCLKN